MCGDKIGDPSQRLTATAALTMLAWVFSGCCEALIHEEFGDGIMSAIDFDLDLSRQPDPNGDRVKIVMTGKFLKYKKS